MKPVTGVKTCVFRWNSTFSAMANATHYFFVTFGNFRMKISEYILRSNVHKTYFLEFWFFSFCQFCDFFLIAPMFKPSEISEFKKCAKLRVSNLRLWNFAWISKRSEGNIFVYHHIDVPRTAHARDSETCYFEKWSYAAAMLVGVSFAFYHMEFMKTPITNLHHPLPIWALRMREIRFRIRWLVYSWDWCFPGQKRFKLPSKSLLLLLGIHSWSKLP